MDSFEAGPGESDTDLSTVRFEDSCRVSSCTWHRKHTKSRVGRVGSGPAVHPCRTSRLSGLCAWWPWTRQNSERSCCSRLGIHGSDRCCQIRLSTTTWHCQLYRNSLGRHMVAPDDLLKIYSTITAHIQVNSTITAHVQIYSTITAHIQINSTITAHIQINSTIMAHSQINSSIMAHIQINSIITAQSRMNSTISADIQINSTIKSWHKFKLNLVCSIPVSRVTIQITSDCQCRAIRCRVIQTIVRSTFVFGRIRDLWLSNPQWKVRLVHVEVGVQVVIDWISIPQPFHLEIGFFCRIGCHTAFDPHRFRHVHEQFGQRRKYPGPSWKNKIIKLNIIQKIFEKYFLVTNNHRTCSNVSEASWEVWTYLWRSTQPTFRLSQICSRRGRCTDHYRTSTCPETNNTTVMTHASTWPDYIIVIIIIIITVYFESISCRLSQG